MANNHAALFGLVHQAGPFILMALLNCHLVHYLSTLGAVQTCCLIRNDKNLI